MKTYNVVWEEEVIEYHSGQVSETQLLQYCKDKKLKLPTGITEFGELVMECAESLDQRGVILTSSSLEKMKKTKKMRLKSISVGY